MLRVPGSINSKTRNKQTYQRNSEHDSADEQQELTERQKLRVEYSTSISQVKVIQEWNGHTPAINYLLRDFREYLIQKKIDHYHRQNLSKTFLPNNNKSGSIDWIESNILQAYGLSDYRKLTINLILARYLINVKKYSYEQAYDTIIEWLNKCAAKRPLQFNANYLVNKALNDAIYTEYKFPMRYDTMKCTRPEMYDEIFSNTNTNTRALVRNSKGVGI
jgi:hypothetical protein